MVHGSIEIHLTLFFPLAKRGGGGGGGGGGQCSAICCSS